jgi:hypothetical protein
MQLKAINQPSALQNGAAATTDAPMSPHKESDWVSVAPHQLKSAGLDQVLSALRAGGSLTELQTSFYSGGYSYTHVLTTKRGAQYRVSKQVLRGVPAAAVPDGAQP